METLVLLLYSVECLFLTQMEGNWTARCVFSRPIKTHALKLSFSWQTKCTVCLISVQNQDYQIDIICFPLSQIETKETFKNWIRHLNCHLTLQPLCLWHHMLPSNAQRGDDVLFLVKGSDGGAAEDGNQTQPVSQRGGWRHGSHRGRFEPGDDEMRWDPALQKPQPVC